MRVWRRACDFLGLMKDPAICSSILGPSRSSQGATQKIGSINWNEGATKMIAHIPFYILGEQEGKGYSAPSPLFMYLCTLVFKNAHGENNDILFSNSLTWMNLLLFCHISACGFTCTSPNFGA